MHLTEVLDRPVDILFTDRRGQLINRDFLRFGEIDLFRPNLKGRRVL